jgi:hypothetical protein
MSREPGAFTQKKSDGKHVKTVAEDAPDANCGN